MSSILASVSSVSVLPPVTGAGGQALGALQAVSGQIAGQPRAAAEARLQELIETYRRLAPIADAQILAVLAKQIGRAAKALGDTATSLPAAPSVLRSSAGQPSAAADDNGAKTVLAQAGAVLETIRQRLALAAAEARRGDGAKAALAVVKAAARAVDVALDAFGGSAGPVATPSAASLDLTA